MPEAELSAFQKRVLATPEDCDLFLGGGRGGGKSFTLALMAMRHAEQYRERARILFVRQTLPGAADFVALTRELFAAVYGSAASYNASSHTWTLPPASYFEIGPLSDPSDFSRYQGRSFSLLLIDEAAQWADPSQLDLLRSNLRGPADVPTRVVLAANPGGVGHQWLAQRYVFKSDPWVPFTEEKSGREFVYCPSTYRDNAFIERSQYAKQIEAATATDPELGRAWLEGDWTVARGAFFGAVLEESRNAIPNWEPGSIDPKAWGLYLAYDHGSSAPAVAYVVGRSPGAYGPDQRFYPKDSILLLDELAIHEPGSVTTGLQYTIPRVAEELHELASRWGMRAEGAADDAIFGFHGSQSGSISDEFRRCDVYFEPAGKGDRRHGWETMRRMLADAGKPDVSGLYVARRCSYFWQTVPFLARDPRRPDDVDSRGADHGADAVRYALTYDPRRYELSCEPLYL